MIVLHEPSHTNLEQKNAGLLGPALHFAQDYFAPALSLS
jgi:hypothetical protein